MSKILGPASTSRILCVFCLDFCHRPIVLQSCKHLEFFENVIYKARIKDMVVCVLCHSMLVKCNDFKNQVMESVQKLYDKTDKISTGRKMCNLQMTTPKIVELREKVTSERYIEIFPLNFTPVSETIDYQKPHIVSCNTSKYDKLKKTNPRILNKKVTTADNYPSTSSTAVTIDKIHKMVIDSNFLSKDPSQEIEVKLENIEENTIYDNEDCNIKTEYQNTTFKVTDGTESCDVIIKDEIEIKEENICEIDIGEEGVFVNTRLDNKEVSNSKTNDSHPGGERVKEDSIVKPNEENLQESQECDIYKRIPLPGGNLLKSGAYRYHRKKNITHTCNECGKTLSSKHALQEHIKSFHTVQTEFFTCDICKNKFKTPRSLKSHISVVHQYDPSEQTYCISCDMTFKNAANLRHHMKTNSAHIGTDGKKFECTACDRKFLLKNLLDKHVNFVHLNKCKFICSHCGKRFQDKRKLNRHVTCVHEKQPKVKNKICDICGRAFETIHILRTHIRTHTGERPLHCDLCDSTFAHNGALYTHKKLVHKVKHKRAQEKRPKALDKSVQNT